MTAQSWQLNTMNVDSVDVYANDFVKKIEDIGKAVRELRRQNEVLERIRGQAIIHLKQLQDDAARIRAIQRKWFIRLEQSKAISTPAAPVMAAVPIYRPEPVQLSVPISTLPPQMEVPMPPQHLPPKSRSKVDSMDKLKMKRQNVNYFTESLSPKMPQDSVRLLYVIESNGIICSVRFNSDGRMFAFADGKTIYVADTSDGTIISTFDISGAEGKGDMCTRSVRFSPDNRLLVAVNVNNTISVFSLASQEQVATLQAHTSIISSMVFSNDSKYLYSAGFDGRLCVWDMHTYTLKMSPIEHNTSGNAQDPAYILVSLGLASDESFLAIGFMSGDVGIYTKSGDEFDFTKPKRFTAHAEYLLNLSVSPSNSMIATVSHDKTANIWNVGATANLVHTLKGHENFVLSATFSPKEDIVVTGSKDENLMFWDAHTGEPLMRISAHQNTVFDVCHHPKERMIVSCSGEGLVCVLSYTM